MCVCSCTNCILRPWQVIGPDRDKVTSTSVRIKSPLPGYQVRLEGKQRSRPRSTLKGEGKKAKGLVMGCTRRMTGPTKIEQPQVHCKAGHTHTHTRELCITRILIFRLCITY